MGGYYHLHVFPVAPGADPEAALAASLAAGSDDLPAEQTEWQRRLSAALRMEQPSLERRGPDPDVLRSFEEEFGPGAGAGFAAMKENEFQDENGVYVSLDSAVAAAGVPLGFEGEDAEFVCRCAWEYLQTIAGAAPLGVFDPNLGRVVDLDSDFNALLRSYAQQSEASLERGS